MKKTAESRENDSGREKTERDVSLSCAFYQGHFVFYLSYLGDFTQIHSFSIVLWEQTVKTTCSSWITSYPYTHYIFNKHFY